MSDNSSKSQQETYTAAQLREYVRESLGDRENEDLLPHAGLVPDDDAREVLNFVATIYDEHAGDELPDRFEDSRAYRAIVRGQATDMATDAVEAGNVSQMQYTVGMVNHDKDASDPSVRDWMYQRVLGEAYVGLITGGMGAGKTDFALDLADGWQLRTRGTVASNIPSLDDADRCIQNYHDLEDWVQNTSGSILFVFDEAGQEATGSGVDSHAAKALAKRIRLIRKAPGAAGSDRCMLIIDQSGMVDKEIRRLVRETGDVWHKESKKRVAVYEHNVPGDPTDQVRTIQGIPPTRWEYDTGDKADFDLHSALDDDGDEEETNPDAQQIKTAIRAVLRGDSQREVAELVDYSRGWVGDRWRDWKAGEYRDLVEVPHPAKLPDHVDVEEVVGLADD